MSPRQTSRNSSIKTAETMHEKTQNCDIVKIPTPTTAEQFAKVLKLSAAQRALRYFSDFDKRQTYGTFRPDFSDDQFFQLERSFKRSPDRDVAQQVEGLYTGGLEYGKKLIGVQDDWGRSVAELMVLLMRWEGYESLASLATIVCRKTRSGKKLISDYFDNGNEPDDAMMIWENGRYRAEITGPNRLYHKIMDKQADAGQSLNMLKNAFTPFVEFLHTPLRLCNGESVLPRAALPKVIDVMIDEPAKLPAQNDVRFRKWFYDDLLRRKALGESLTIEDHQRAVIPSYSRARTSDLYLGRYTESLHNIYYQFFNQ